METRQREADVLTGIAAAAGNDAMHVVQDPTAFFESIEGLTRFGHDHGAFQAHIGPLELRPCAIKGKRQG